MDDLNKATLFIGLGAHLASCWRYSWKCRTTDLFSRYPCSPCDASFHCPSFHWVQFAIESKCTVVASSYGNLCTAALLVISDTQQAGFLSIVNLTTTFRRAHTWLVLVTSRHMVCFTYSLASATTTGLLLLTGGTNKTSAPLKWWCAPLLIRRQASTFRNICFPLNNGTPHSVLSRHTSVFRPKAAFRRESLYYSARFPPTFFLLPLNNCTPHKCTVQTHFTTRPNDFRFSSRIYKWSIRPYKCKKIGATFPFICMGRGVHFQTDNTAEMSLLTVVFTVGLCFFRLRSLVFSKKSPILQRFLGGVSTVGFWRVKIFGRPNFFRF